LHGNDDDDEDDDDDGDDAAAAAADKDAEDDEGKVAISSSVDGNRSNNIAGFHSGIRPTE
jgi:hypothetical protein